MLGNRYMKFISVSQMEQAINSHHSDIVHVKYAIRYSSLSVYWNSGKVKFSYTLA